MSNSETVVTNSANIPPEYDFKAMALGEPLQKGLEACGFTKPTEVQASTIPMVLMGRDVMASAQTGTGKTAAFVLPALQRLLTFNKGPGRGPRVLILTPTRELATQVEGVVRDLSRFTKVRSGIIVGGVAYGPQERLLRQGVDLLVATPGRLMDHMSSGLIDYNRLELFVLDEADRMLDMGFIHPVKQIAAAMPAGRQTLLFSATLEGQVLEVARILMNDPARVQLSSNRERHASINQETRFVSTSEQKHSVLSDLLAAPEVTQAIIFTATKRGADRLAKRVSEWGHACAALHGNMRQSARTRTVAALQSGRVQFLVATDVAARGIDVEGISHVINFDLPTVAEDYIHRIGRTGRNGASGTAISLVGPQDREKLGAIERLTGGSLGKAGGSGDVPFFTKGPSRGRGAGRSGAGGRAASPRGNGASRGSGNSAGGGRAASPRGNGASRGNGGSSVRNVAAAPVQDTPPARPQARRRSRPVATRSAGW